MSEIITGLNAPTTYLVLILACSTVTLPVLALKCVTMVLQYPQFNWYIKFTVFGYKNGLIVDVSLDLIVALRHSGSYSSFLDANFETVYDWSNLIEF